MLGFIEPQTDHDGCHGLLQQQPFLAAGDGRLSHDVVLNRGNGRQERVDDAGDFRFGTAPAFGLGGNECRDVEAEGVGCVPLNKGRLHACSEPVDGTCGRQRSRGPRFVVAPVALLPRLLMFGVKGFDPVTLRKPSCDLWERHGLLRELDGTLDPRAAFGELCLNVKGARLSQIYRKLDSSKPAYTITGSGGGGTHVYHWKESRALTNRERARLQTFPDDFVFRGSKESVRKQIGMAVPCDGAQVILEALLKTFEGEAYESVTPSVGIFPAKTFDPDA